MKALIHLLLMGMPLLLNAQEPLFTIPLPVPVNNFAVDQFEQLFITQNEELQVLTKKGKYQNSYSQPLYGDISQIDVSNALNILLFFGETYRISLIDNHLNEKLNYSLIDQGFNDPKLVSISDERHIWVYDQNEDKIIRFGLESRKRTHESLNISQILGKENYPNQICSVFDRIYLNVPESGILVFDALGAFQKLIQIQNIEYFGLYDQNLFYYKNGQINRLNIRSGNRKLMLNYSKDLKNFRISNGKIFILNPSEIEVFELEEA